ncbi:MAG: hypothetical protein ABI317_12485 [Gaiellales bacterium]
MARRTAALKPQLNQIRTWAREGRTDAWIAYQLGTTSATVQEFRFEYGLDKGPGNPVEEPVTPEHVVQTISFDSPPPLPPLEPSTASGDNDAPAPTRRQRRSRPAKVDEESLEVEVEIESGADPDIAVEGESDPDRPKRRRRRGGRGGGSTVAGDATAASDPPAAPSEKPSPAAARRKGRAPASYRGSVVAGAVLVLDPAVTRSAAWRAHWADAPAFDVVVEDEQIVLRRRTAD